MYDKKGKDGSLRVAVPVADRVRLSNFTEDSKEYVESRAERNLDAAAQEARQNEIFSNRNSEEALSRAAQIARSGGGGGNAFLGKSFDLDFDELQLAVADKDAEAEDEEAEDETGEDTASDKKPAESSSPAKTKSTSGKPKAQAKKKAWDRATAVASKIRAETTSICTLQLQMKNRLDECQETLALLSTKGDQCNDEVRVEKSTLEKRALFLSAVLEPSKARLLSLIAQYDRDASAAGAGEKPTGENAAATVVTSWHAQLETSPLANIFDP